MTGYAVAAVALVAILAVLAPAQAALVLTLAFGGDALRLGRRIARRLRGDRGQALAETALVLPLLLFIALGFTEAGILVSAKADQDRATSTVAAWAAEHPEADWSGVAARELPGCEVDVERSVEPPDLVTASATCTYRPRVTHGLWDGLPISSEQTSAAAPAPSAVP